MELSRRTKSFILIAMDLTIIYISIRFVSYLLEKSEKENIVFFVLFAMLYLLLGLLLKVFSVVNRFTDYGTLFKLVIVDTVIVSGLFLLSFIISYPVGLRFAILSLVFTLLLTIIPRLTWRFLFEYQNGRLVKGSTLSKKRVLVVGAGVAANLFIKTVHQSSKDMHIVGMVDRDKAKLNAYIQGVKVIGLDSDIVEVVKKYSIEQIVIAIPSLTSEDYHRILDLCQQSGAKVKVMPDYEEVIKGNLSISKLREIDIADLLGRKEVELDLTAIANNLSGKTVLVTGAGGSIGSELCRQIATFKPARLLLLGHGENSIYLIHRELLGRYSGEIELVPLIADIQDRDRLFEIMAKYKPHRVYHAAAHKHVPLMEYNPTEAIKNNIFGTRNVAEAAKAHHVEKFVMVSTDKAVNPPNVMGATKRVAEMIVTSLNEEGQTKFAAVRFGNVLGSRGSVVPLFKEQIAKGGPVTVTDFRMTRYFMTIPEASRLILQAGSLMEGGEIFVLDMGEPVKILDLAKKVIKLSGHTEEEIPIVESGIRPGEKLYEELLSSDERVSEQVYDKIFLGEVGEVSVKELNDFIHSLAGQADEDLKVALVGFAKQEH